MKGLSLLFAAWMTLGAGADSFFFDCRAAGGGAACPALAVGDTLEFVLSDDATLSLRVLEKTPSGLGGYETFLAESAGYEGMHNAVIVCSDAGMRIRVQDDDNKRIHTLSVTADGISARTRKMSGKGHVCGGTFVPPEHVTRTLPVDDSVRAGRKVTATNRTVRATAARKRPPLAAAVQKGETYVDVLVAYDRRGAAWARENGGGTTNFANEQITRVNGAIANTGLDKYYRYRLVGVCELDADARGVLADAVEFAQLGTNAWHKVLDMREATTADVVTVLIDSPTEPGITTGVVGLGYSLYDLNTDWGWEYYNADFPDYAFSACMIGAADETHTMAHEIGHNMGAGHSELCDNSPGPQYHDYSRGYYFTGTNAVDYYTIMSYSTYGTSGKHYTEAPFFSSPDYSYFGTRVGDATHNNTETLRQNFETVSKFRGWIDASDVGQALGEDAAKWTWVTTAYHPWIVEEGIGSVSGSEPCARSGEIEGLLSSKLRGVVTVPKGNVVTISFDFLVRTAGGSFTVCCDGKEVLEGYHEVRKNMSVWEQAQIEINTSGEHTLEFTYTHPAQGYDKGWGNGVRLDNFKAEYQERNKVQILAEAVTFSTKTSDIGGTVSPTSTLLALHEDTETYDSVILRATANKGFWFAGWYKVDTETGAEDFIYDYPVFTVTPKFGDLTHKYWAQFVFASTNHPGSYSGTARLNPTNIVLDTVLDETGFATNAVWSFTLDGDGKVRGSITLADKTLDFSADYSRGYLQNVKLEKWLEYHFTVDAAAWYGTARTLALKLKVFNNGSASLLKDTDVDDMLVTPFDGDAASAKAEQPNVKIPVTVRCDTKQGTVSSDADVLTTQKPYVTVTATPKTGYWFVGWYEADGSLFSSNRTCVLTIDDTRINSFELTAKFTALDTSFVGTYTGCIRADVAGSVLTKSSIETIGIFPVTVSLDKSGKLSGTITLDTVKLNLASSACDAYDADTGALTYRAALDEKALFKSNVAISETLVLTFCKDGTLAICRDETATAGSDVFANCAGLANRAATSADSTALNVFAGTYVACITNAEDWVVPVTLTVAQKGSVTAQGYLPNGKSFSGKGTLSACRTTEAGKTSTLELFVATQNGSDKGLMHLHATFASAAAEPTLDASQIFFNTSAQPKPLSAAFCTKAKAGGWVPPELDDPQLWYMRVETGDELVDVALASAKGVIGLGKVVTAKSSAKLTADTGLLIVTTAAKTQVQGLLTAPSNSLFGTVTAKGTHAAARVSFHRSDVSQDYACTNGAWRIGLATSLPLKVTVNGLAAALKVSGLPAGLKYQADTGLITGSPTKSGSFTVSVTYSVLGQNVTQKIPLTVAALPVGVEGTYTGCIRADIAGSILTKSTAATVGTFPVTATIDKTGKLSGTITLNTVKLSLNAAACESYDADKGVMTYRVTLDEKNLFKAKTALPETLVLTFCTDGSLAIRHDETVTSGNNVFAVDAGSASRAATSANSAELNAFAGTYVACVTNAENWVIPVTLTVAQKGSVTAQGYLPNGKSFSGKGTLTACRTTVAGKTSTLELFVATQNGSDKGLMHLHATFAIPAGSAAAEPTLEASQIFFNTSAQPESEESLSVAFCTQAAAGSWFPEMDDPQLWYACVETEGEPTVEIALKSTKGVIGLGKVVTAKCSAKLADGTGLLTVTTAAKTLIQGILTAPSNSLFGAVTAEGAHVAAKVSFKRSEVYPDYSFTNATWCVGLSASVPLTVTVNGSAAALKVSGLPAGLKYQAKTGLLEGTPTKAGAFTVSVTYAVLGQNVTQKIPLTVKALPAGIEGTFNGYAKIDLPGQTATNDASISVTVKNTGALSGSLTLCGKKATWTATGYQAMTDATVTYTNLAIHLEKADKSFALRTWDLTISTNGVLACVEGETPVAWAWRDDSRLKAVTASRARFAGTYEWAPGETAETALTVSVDSKGNARLAGQLAKKNATVSATGVWAASDEADKAVLYFVTTCKALGNGSLFVRVNLTKPEDGTVEAAFDARALSYDLKKGVAAPWTWL